VAYCRQCGNWFPRQASERWKTLCLECWKERKRGELEELQEENEYLRWRLTEAEAQVSRLTVNPALSDFLRVFPLLVRLCHPDRNGGSQEATEATRWLLDMREIAKKLPGGAADAHRVR